MCVRAKVMAASTKTVCDLRLLPQYVVIAIPLTPLSKNVSPTVSMFVRAKLMAAGLTSMTERDYNSLPSEFQDKQKHM